MFQYQMINNNMMTSFIKIRHKLHFRTYRYNIMYAMPFK